MPVSAGAEFSPCRTYRYRLWRLWSGGSGLLTFIMLNPSTANELLNDPTVERCARRARLLGYNAVEVVSLFALRSTQPGALYKHKDPVGGAQNDVAILDAAGRARLVICAWGVHGMLNSRGAIVRGMLRDAAIQVSALNLLRCGEPGHPLYIPYRREPFSISFDPR
jgi:hypothetical protein